jgi:hypothetical protein
MSAEIIDLATIRFFRRCDDQIARMRDIVARNLNSWAGKTCCPNSDGDHTFDFTIKKRREHEAYVQFH